jgi:hypothetical protein
MTDMKDLVSLYFERGNAMETLWGLYITIALGMLAFFGAATASVKRYFLAVVLSLGFAGFALVNEDALHDVTWARSMIQQIILQKSVATAEERSLQDMVRAIPPSSVSEVRIFHFTVDAGVLIAIWGMTLGKQKRGAALT